MSERIKYTLKQLKQPDRFRQFALNVIQKIPENFNKILYGIVIVILALIAIYIVSANREAQRMDASQIFDEGLDQYNSGRIEEALGTFSELNEKYPGLKPSKVAVYYSGIINYEIGNYEESIELLNNFLDKNPNDNLLVNSSLFTIGLSYFNLENWDKAIETLSELEDKQSPYQSKALLHIGMAYEKKGESVRSEEYYKRVLEQNTGGFQINQAGTQR